MRNQDKKRMLTATVIIGFICIIMVVLAAYAAELRVENNSLINSNEALQGEIDTLSVKIKSANNIDHIEKVATASWVWFIPARANAYMYQMMMRQKAILPW